MDSLLFYRRGGLGDTLLTFPVLEVLYSLNYEITTIGNCDYFEIAKLVGWVKECFYDFYEKIKARDFKKRIVFSINEIPPFPKTRQWIVDYYFDILNLPKKFSLVLPFSNSLKNNPLKDKAVLHPGSGSLKKVPPVELFLKIEGFLKSLGLKVCYLIGEADEWIKDFAQNYWESVDVVEIASALREARLFVGVDSGISHLACYLGVKSFVFFGPTDSVVWKPLGSNYELISTNEPCSPCFPKVCKTKECLSPERLFSLFLKKFKM